MDVDADGKGVKGWTITDYRWRDEVLTGKKINWIAFENSLTTEKSFEKSEWRNNIDGYKFKPIEIDNGCEIKCKACRAYTRAQDNFTRCGNDICLPN